MMHLAVVVQGARCAKIDGGGCTACSGRWPSNAPLPFVLPDAEKSLFIAKKLLCIAKKPILIAEKSMLIAKRSDTV